MSALSPSPLGSPLQFDASPVSGAASPSALSVVPAAPLATLRVDSPSGSFTVALEPMAQIVKPVKPVAVMSSARTNPAGFMMSLFLSPAAQLPSSGVYLRDLMKSPANSPKAPQKNAE